MNSGLSGKRSPSSKLPNALEMLRRVANFRYPDEEVRGEGQCITQKLQDAFTLEAQKATKNFWPELWESENPLRVLFEMRNLLRSFWCEPDERKRDWYIHRAREYHQAHNISRTMGKEWQEVEDQLRQQIGELVGSTIYRLELSGLDHLPVMDRLKQLIGEPLGDTEHEYLTPAFVAAQASSGFSRVSAAGQRKLDEPPVSNRFENALYSLQERARKPSRAPRCCQRKDKGCIHPYFFANKTSRKFCSTECAQLSAQESRLASWHRHKTEWRTR